jgi:peptide/nickel transport system substrate-binding protein
LALIEAVDRGRIVQTVFGPYSPVADAPLSRPTYAVQPGNLFPAFNPAHAAEVLDGAGWIDADGDGIREKDGEQLSLHIVTPTWGSNAEAAQLIKADWEALGARVTIEVAAGFGPLVETQSEGQYHAIGLNLFDTDPDLLRSFFASEGRYNWTGYSDERLDELLHTAAFSVLDPIQRAELYTEISATIAENALILPVREYVNLVIARSELKGLRFSAQGWFPLLIELHLDS